MAEPKKVLIVDDDMFKRADRLKHLLAGYCIDLDMVEDFYGAMKMFKSNKFDLILLDVGLKGARSGIETLKEMRRSDKIVRINIISAYAEYKDEALAAGASQYFVKPFDYRKHILEPLALNSG